MSDKNIIKNLIKEEFQKIFEDFRYLYDTTYIPPQNVINTVQKALEVISKNKLVDSNGSNEGSGLRKAKAIINKEPMTHAQIKRMKAFFDNNYKEKKNEKALGKNINNSALLQSWDLWGGDAGELWADGIINKSHSKNDSSKTIRGASGIRTKTLMDPNNTRTHSVHSKIKNSL